MGNKTTKKLFTYPNIHTNTHIKCSVSATTIQAKSPGNYKFYPKNKNSKRVQLPTLIHRYKYLAGLLVEINPKLLTYPKDKLIYRTCINLLDHLLEEKHMLLLLVL